MSILKKERSKELLEDWFLCNLFEKAKTSSCEMQIQILNSIKNFSNIFHRDYDVECQRFYSKNKDRWMSNESEWLRGVIQFKNSKKRRVSFRDACEYLDEGIIYEDFQRLSSFVHGQDIASKCFPFIFYSSIYEKLLIMVTYIFKVIRLFGVTTDMEEEIQKLENELSDIQKIVL